MQEALPFKEFNDNGHIVFEDGTTFEAGKHWHDVIMSRKSAEAGETRNNNGTEGQSNDDNTIQQFKTNRDDSKKQRYTTVRSIDRHVLP